MKVQELFMNIKNDSFNLEASLQVNKYLPMEVKKTIAQGVIFDCTNDDEGAIKVDSVQRYMSYVRYMITAHTNLDYTDDDYDALCSTEYGETNLLNAIMNCFGDDARECMRILDLMMADYMQEMSIEFAIAKFLNGLGKSIDVLTKKLGALDVKSIIPDGADTSKLGTFLQKYIK